MVPILCEGGINATEVHVSVRPTGQSERIPFYISDTDHILVPYYS